MDRVSFAGVLRRALVFCVFFASMANAADDVVAVRVGTGTLRSVLRPPPCSSTNSHPDGTAMGSMPLPIAADGMNINMAFTLSGTGTSEGALADTPDGHYVTLAGYAVAPGAPISGALRVVARIDCQWRRRHEHDIGQWLRHCGARRGQQRWRSILDQRQWHGRRRNLVRIARTHWRHTTRLIPVASA